MGEKQTKFIKNHEDLEVDQIAFNTAMTIFVIFKEFPKLTKLVEKGRELYSQYNKILAMMVKMANNVDKWV
ncbi:MAG: hypothetical protein GDA44_09000 [Prochloron sp. SP5CPC1]|nr:hypothetical protein [Candidatus Paraprochloron terpiosi SP5CPC1]